MQGYSENRILEYWKTIDAFQTSLRLSKDRPEFTLYDGPPFATGLPHYGHLVASTIKDIFPRWKTMTGYHVPRQWCWDGHGLPIEFEIEKMLGIKTKQQVLELGIDKYNEACREIVMKYSQEWKTTIDRLGRWVDMDNDCKTIDREYMESVWWVFSELFKKGLVYRGYKVIYYSMGCKSPISNFEAKSNYKSTSDWAINIKFELSTKEIALVFTTTPWSLPANLAIAVNPDFDYCKIKLEDSEDANIYIIGKPHLERTLGKRKYKIVETLKGKTLVGMKYKPLFDYFKDYRSGKTFKIYGAEFVVAEKGTGLVHCSPAHGDEDYKLCLNNGMFGKTEIPPCPLDDDCNFTSDVTHFKGMNVKNSEDDIVAHLKDRNQLFSKGKEVHDYPFCWRSDTPLLQKVCECWFIDVKKLTSQLLENNDGVNWIPNVIGRNRFGEWLKNSQDWCVSRNRFWGTPMNIWSDSSGTQTVCVNSVVQLEHLAQLEQGSIDDIHRHNIDHITIPNPKGGEPLRRVEFVFDCWMDSGCIPYARNHFPFAKGVEYKPADLIAEGLDQTRGWFYTLLVVGTGLFGESPYKNVIVNGIVLASDGEKMSKRKKNYPPVDGVLDEFGADALRLYLINTPVVKAGDIKFTSKDMREVVRKYSMMFQNATKFFFEMKDLYLHKRSSSSLPIKKQYSSINKQQFKLTPFKECTQQNLTVMDQWILQCLNELIVSVRELMDNYHLNGIIDKFYKFIDQLSKWYMNLNKKRYKKCENTVPLDILGNSLYYFALISAPFAPFLTEHVYLQLREVGCPHSTLESIHFHQIPTTVWKSNGDLLELFEYVSDIVDITRSVRAKRVNTSVKLPLLKVTLVHSKQTVLDTLKRVEEYLTSQLNIEKILYSTDVDALVEYDLQACVSTIKHRLQGREVGEAIKYVKNLSPEQKQMIGCSGSVPDDSPVKYEELNVIKRARQDIKVETTNRITVEYDDSITPKLLCVYTCNQFHRAYQQERKNAKLVQTDKITFEYSCSRELNDILNSSGVVERNEGIYIPLGVPEPTNYLTCTKHQLELGEVTILLRK